jgi:hypothetical protein
MRLNDKKAHPHPCLPAGRLALPSVASRTDLKRRGITSSLPVKRRKPLVPSPFKGEVRRGMGHLSE